MLLWATVATSLSQSRSSFFRSLLFFWQHSENWVFLKTVSFHFQILKWAFTLQWCKTLAWKPGLKDLSHVQSRRNLLKYLVRVEMASDWFTRIYRSIFAEQNFLQNLDLACKLGLLALLEPAMTTVESIGKRSRKSLVCRGCSVCHGILHFYIKTCVELSKEWQPWKGWGNGRKNP